MNLRKFFTIFIGFFVLFFLFVVLSHPANAQSLGCVVTKVGNPTGATPTLPPGCPSVKFTPTGVIPAPNVTKCISVSGGEYCQMPPALNNEYKIISHSEGSKLQDWGSREMINVLYTVAQNWKYNHPQGFLIIGDIASGYHLTHDYGTATDVAATTNGDDCAANHIFDRRCTYGPPYNSAATIELGKLFMNTGIVRQIIYWDKSTNVISELKKHGNTTNTHIAELSDHKNHFHIDIRRANLPNCEFTSPPAC